MTEWINGLSFGAFVALLVGIVLLAGLIAAGVVWMAQELAERIFGGRR